MSEPDRNPFNPRSAEEYDSLVDETSVNLLQRGIKILRSAGAIPSYAPENEPPPAEFLALALTAMRDAHLILANRQQITDRACCPVHGDGARATKPTTASGGDA